MYNNGSVRSQIQTLNMSKFWAFRLINVVSFLSIFLLLSILLIPIPYLHKEREPYIVDLNLNSTGYSHAIKISSRKLPGKVISVSFSTHNTDHIIGSTFFGDIKLERDTEYISRFVNCHYQDKRKGLPFRIVVIDAYAKHFVLKYYLLQNNPEPTYKQIDASVYMISENMKYQTLDVSLIDLLEKFTSDNIYRVQYEDMDEKVIIHYYAHTSHTIGAVTLGLIKDDLPENAIYRNITIILLKHSDVVKVVLTTFYMNNPEPSFTEYYFSQNNFEIFYHTLEELSKDHEVDLTYESFEINRYENNKTNTIYFNPVKHKNEGLLIFELKTPKRRYDIVLPDKKDCIVNIKIKPQDSNSSGNVETPLDRFLVIEYNYRESKPPNYYIWDRMLYFNRLTVINHLS